MADSKTDIHNFHLDPTVFNQTLYTRLLKHWFASYPNPTRVPIPEDLQRWFGLNSTPEEKDAFDATCRAISLPALHLLGPETLALPPFESFAADHKLYPVLARPFADEFLSDSRTPDRAQREEAALALQLLLDQMARNCFRDAAQRVVYEHYDRLSRALRWSVVQAGLDAVPRWAGAQAWRMWFDMPLLHSEDLRDHEVLEARRREQAARARERGDEDVAKFVEMQARSNHKRALERFGRFPWRNRWVGRENTREEQEFLDNGGGPFTLAYTNKRGRIRPPFPCPVSACSRSPSPMR